MRFKLGFLLFFVLGVFAFSIYMFASAQDNVHISIKVDGEEVSQDNAITIHEIQYSEAQISDNSETTHIRSFRRRSDGTPINMDGSELSESELKDFEMQKARYGQRREMPKDTPPAKSIDKKAVSSPKDRAEAKASPKGQPPATGEDKLKQYLGAIAEKNLFMPLGTVKREEKTNYTVTAIISNTSEDPKPKAVIEQTGSNRSYYVSKGDNLVGEEKVTDIEIDTVKVIRSGEEIALKLGTGTQGGGGWGGGRGERRLESASPGEQAPSRGRASRFDRSQLSAPNFDDPPPMIRRMLEERGISIEDLKNNPELQEKIRQESMQRFGGRRQGPSAEVQMRPR